MKTPPHRTALAQQHYQRLFGQLRDEYVKLASNGIFQDAESLEWGRLSHWHRMALLLLAGVDGDLVALAKRRWRELPELERIAVKSEARLARDAFGRLYALAGRW